MTDFRKFMSIINEAQIEDGHAPPTWEAGDDPHYDALQKTGFFGEQAAGAILMAKTTGRILIMHRSDAVLEPFTFGNVGGAYHTGEDVTQAVRREIKEETGYVSRVPLVPLLVFRKGSFRYSNFLGLVEDEFDPHLGWEAVGFQWCEYGHWPSPLHFGLKALFADPESEKTIRHYVSLYQNSDEHTETLDEDQNIADTMANQAAAQAASSNSSGTPAAPAATPAGTTPPAGTPAPNGTTPPSPNGMPTAPAGTPAAPATPAAGTGGTDDSDPSTGSKSLAPITSQ